jgi:hypothetical protein
MSQIKPASQENRNSHQSARIGEFALLARPTPTCLERGAFLICTCTATDRSGSDHTSLGIPLIPGAYHLRHPRRRFSLPMRVPQFASPFCAHPSCPPPFRQSRGSRAHPALRLQ